MKILHDVHNHNIFSNCCNDPWASTDAFVKKELELGNKIFGLSNHIWDESVKGASGWYSKQTITKAEEAKASLAKAPKELKCLFGAESEYFHCHDRLGMSVEGAKRFDYMLIPHSHQHMRNQVLWDLPEIQEMRAKIAADVQAALPYLEKAGATLVYGCTLPRVNKSGSFLARAVMLYEFRKYIDSYLAKYCSLSHIRNLGDIINFNNANPEAAIKYGQNILEESHRKTSGRLTENLYLSEKVRLTREAGALIDKTLADNEVDLVVHPIFSELPPISGYPILNIPAGIAANGLPTGLSMIAGAFSEAKLLAWGYAFEQASQLRVVPEAAKI